MQLFPYNLYYFDPLQFYRKKIQKVEYLLYIDLNDYKINVHNFITLYILKETKKQNPKQTNPTKQQIPNNFH